MDESQVSDEQLDATIAARQQEQAQAAVATPIPDKADADKLSDEDLDKVILHHRIRQEQELAPFRERMQRGEGPAASVAEGVGPYLARQAVSAIRAPLTNALYGVAKSRQNAGTATDGDLYAIAAYEHEQRLNQQQPEAAKWGGVLAGAPGQIATFGVAPATTLAAHAVGGAAAEAQAAPWNLAALSHAGVQTAAQLAILKSMGPAAELIFPGAQSTAARIGSQALAGTTGLAVADYGTHVLGITEGGGPIKDALDGRLGDAARAAASNLLMTGGLAAAHGGAEAGKQVVDDALKTADAARKRGVSAQAALAAAKAQAEATVAEKVQAAAQPPAPEPPAAQDAPGAAQPGGGQQPAQPAEVAPQGQPGAPRPPEDAIRWKQPIGPDEPPVAEGMIRMYHGGVLGGKGGRDFTPDRAYAEGYAAKTEGAEVGYVDLPRNSPLLSKAFDDTGTSSAAPPVHLHAPADLAESMRPLKAAEPEPQLPPELAGLDKAGLLAFAKSVGIKGVTKASSKSELTKAVANLLGGRQPDAAERAINESVRSNPPEEPNAPETPGPVGGNVGAGEPGAGPVVGRQPAENPRMPVDELHRRLTSGLPIEGVSAVALADLKANVLDGKTFEEIGRKRGVTKQAVQQSAEKALQKLHGKIEEPEPPSMDENEDRPGTARFPRAAAAAQTAEVGGERLVNRQLHEVASDRLTDWIAGEAKAGREPSADTIDRIDKWLTRLDGPPGKGLRKAAREASAWLDEQAAQRQAGEPAPVRRAEPAGPVAPAAEPESRPPAAPHAGGPPADAGPQAAGHVVGHETTIALPDGSTVPARYEVRDLGSVRASHQVLPNGALRTRPPAEYPANLQPRDYSAAGEQQKVSRIASGMVPSILVTNHPAASEGPPTITADGTVLNGNGRQMGLERSAGVGTYARYKAELIRQAQTYGLDQAAVEKIGRPALYRVVDMDPQGEPARRFAAAGNVSLTQGQSPVRTAASLARMVTPEVIDSLKLDGDTTFSEAVTDPKNGKAFRDRLRGELPAQEVARYFHEDGRLTDAGTELVRSMLLAKVLPADLIERMGEEMKGVKRTLEGAIPQLVQVMRDFPSAHVGPQLVEALNVLARNPDVRTPGDADNVLAQGSLFGGKAETLSPGGRMMLDFVLENGNKPLVFRRKLGAFVNDLAGTKGLFGEEFPDMVTMAAESLGVQRRDGAAFGDLVGADREVADAARDAQRAGANPRAVEEVVRRSEAEGLAEGGARPGPGGEPAGDQSNDRSGPDGPIFGMGAAGLRELTPRGPGTGPRRGPTALANAKIDAERSAEGLTLIATSARMENPEAWDAAMRRLDADPDAGKKLVAELVTKPRPVDVTEGAMLLREKISLDNEYRVLGKDLVRGGADGIDTAALEKRLDDLAEQRYDLALAVRRTGTELGRSLQFRKQLAASDYSLAGMLQELRVAAGREPTAEEAKKVAELQAKIEELQGKLAAAEKTYQESGAKPGTRVFDDMQKARVAANRAQGEFADQLKDLKDAKRPLSQRVLDALLAWQRFSILSGVKTLGKIVTAAGESIAVGPAKELAGAAWGWIPGISRIAAKATAEGRLSGQAEAASLRSIFQGIKDGYQKMTTGRSDLDALYGTEEKSRSWLDWPQAVHAGLKAPALRAAYERSFAKRLAAEDAAGRDATSPATVLKVGTQAYMDAHRAIFMENNKVVELVNQAIDKMRSPNNSAGTQAVGLAAKTLLPIVKVPTNVVVQSFEAAFGVLPGLTRAALVPYRGGIENLSADQANLIMRQLKAGSIGGAMFVLGALNPKMFGGFYGSQQDEKKRKGGGDVPAGAVRIGGTTLPAWTQHNPVLLAAQMGSAFRRTLDKTYRGQPETWGDALIASSVGMLKETPLVEQQGRMVEALTTPGGRGRFLGQYLGTFAVPRAVQDLASVTDPAPNRKAEGAVETLQKGIPGLRERLPASR